jgi:hypothetical protein
MDMRDPHVVSLRYKLGTDDKTRYKDPAPVEYEIDEFRLRLHEGILTCRMKQDFPSEQDARKAVEPLLRAWELDAALTRGDSIRFLFNKAEVIDRDPPHPGTAQVVLLRALDLVAVAEAVSVVVEQSIYPQPPRSFVASPDVETMWHRYTGYLNGREHLLAMANFCLSLVMWLAEGEPGKKKLEKTSHWLNIDPAILRQLSKWAANRGDTKTARKIDAQSTFEPLTQAEVAWVEAAVKALIHQLGTHASGTQPRRLRMSDLPPT